uniref:MFS domain-containing protein n=1 Tax=Caenorhabditis tropicalis TaxID=1561998 RepID=A0A1I7UN53_9PELO
MIPLRQLDNDGRELKPRKVRRRPTLYALNENKGIWCCPVNVEPILFLVMCGFGLSATNNSLFTYWARCVQIAQDHKELTHNATYTCASITSYNGTLQDDVEKDIANTKIYLQIIGTIPTLIVSPLIGNWSDRNGRKAPLLFSLFGLVLNNFLFLCATLSYETINVYYWFFVSELLMGMFGGGAATFSTSLAIVTDDCRHKLKPGSSTIPFRVGLASFVQSIGMLSGTLVVSILAVPAIVSVERHALSYVKCAFIQTGLALIALIYGIFFVRETHFPKREDFSYNQFDDNEEIEEEVAPPKLTGIRQFTTYLESVFGVLTVRRPGWTRLCLCVSLAFVFIEFLSFDPALLLLLVKRLPFAWNDKLFSYFTLTRTVLSSFGMVLCPILLTFSSWLGKDSLLIIGALASSAATSFLTAFATRTEHIFYTCAFGIIMGGMQPAYRSFLPRMVAKEETARLLTSVSIIISFSPILSSLIFNNIFNATLTWWPGFAFFVSGCFQSTVFIGQIIIHMLMRPQWKLDKQLRARRQDETDSRDETDFRPVADAEQRSISNTAVDSDSGSRREI